jgi:hypothetical protein
LLDNILLDLDPVLRAGFIRRGKRNWIRQSHDVFQLINVQKSQYSDTEYVNIAFWPHIAGSAKTLSEHKFPLRGRVENVLGEEAAQEADWPHRLLALLDGQFSSFEALRSAYHKGALDGMYIAGDLRNELEKS